MARGKLVNSPTFYFISIKKTKDLVNVVLLINKIERIIVSVMMWFGEINSFSVGFDKQQSYWLL